MNINGIRPQRCVPFAHCLTGSALALILSVGADAADWKFTAGISASETYTDNATLGASGTRSSDFITAITPRVSAKKEGARLKVDAQYALQNIFYARDSDRNTSYHQLNARANAELLEKEVFLDAAAAVTQSAISLLAPTGTDTLSATGNVANVRTVTLSPYWTHRFGSTANLNVRYTATHTSTDSAGFNSSTTNSLVAGLSSGSDFGRLSWSLNASQQDANFQGRSDVVFSSASASLGYQFSSRWRVVGTVGTENNRFDTTTGTAPDGTFWNVALSWAPSTRTFVEAGFGHRFFGNSYNFAFRTRGAHYTWTAGYSEGLNTSNNQSTISGLGFTSAQPRPADLFLFNRNILTNQVFLSKRFSTAFGWTKGKHSLNLDAFHATQTTRIDGAVNTVTLSIAGVSNANDIFLASNDVKQVGISSTWNYRLSPTISSNVALGVNRNSFTDLNRVDTISSLRLGLDRRFSHQLNGSLSYRHQERSSDQSGFDSAENALIGTINYTF